MGAFYQSYGDVDDEMNRLDPQIEQTDALISNAEGAPTGITGQGVTVNQLSILVPSWQDEGNDNLSNLYNDWNNFYNSWASFYDGRAAQDYETFLPDGAGWSAVMQYETLFAALQTRANNVMNAGLTVIQPQSTGSGASPFSLFPSLTPSMNATLTNVLWVGAIGVGLWLAFPILSDLSGFAGAAGSYAVPQRAAAKPRRSR